MLQAYSKAADVFSFGVILWELVTWQLPWEELGVFQVGNHPLFLLAAMPALQKAPADVILSHVL